MQSAERRTATDPSNKERLLFRRVKLAARGSIAEWNSARGCQGRLESTAGALWSRLQPPDETKSERQKTHPPHPNQVKQTHQRLSTVGLGEGKDQRQRSVRDN